MEELRDAIQDLINKTITCNGKNTIQEQTLKQVIELIDSIALNKNKINKKGLGE